MKNFTEYTKFFGEKGVTSTSANYLSNIAKEISNTYDVLNKISFADVYVQDLGSSNSEYYRVNQGVTKEAFNSLEDSLEKKAKLNNLIAWFREAIRAKDRMLKAMDNYSFEAYLEEQKGITDYEFGFELPHYPEAKEITKEEYIQKNFSIKEMNEYFYLQSMCSTLGKFVHPDGKYADAKKYISEKNNSSYIEQTSSANLLYTVKSSLPIEDIDAKFFHLQHLQREYQKRLNEILFKVDIAVSKYNDDIVAEQKKIRSERESINAKIAETRAMYKKEYFDWISAERNKLRNLKIVIPKELESIFQFVNQYGKNK